MKIRRIDIKNFRKLENIKILMEDKKTLLVGANNSGKTSTIEAMVKFLNGENGKFVLYDWSISNWKKIDAIGEYIVNKEKYEEEEFDKMWEGICPTLDLWFQVDESELHHVVPLIPTLDWNEGFLGVRFVFEPNKLEELFLDYKKIIENNEKIRNGEDDISLWPNNFCHFLKKKLNSYFKLSYYTLDPKMYENEGSIINRDLESHVSSPIKNLVKIDVINAQRGLNDPGDEKSESNNKKLSVELRKYYDDYLKPSEELLEPEDLNFIKESNDVEKRFDKRLNKSFMEPIEELRTLGYPGFTDPQIHVATKINYTDGLNHDSAVQYSTTRNDAKQTRLPEEYTGLGYQNLIWMVFRLMHFREEWLSNRKKNTLKVDKKVTPPLHLVIIEEPEAHLHTQVQRFFVDKAYDVLNHHKLLSEGGPFSTQLLVSTHSSYIIEESHFSNLRYFKRIKCEDCTRDSGCDKCAISPKSEVINLDDVFGTGEKTKRFVTRYIKTTHCDLFFADAAILIEGSAERILLPEFIKRKNVLKSAYLTILEIGGSHAFRLKSLIDKLGIYTLVISDLDPCKEDNSKKVYPEKNKGYVTKNTTLKKWAPQKTLVDDLLSLKDPKLQQEKNVFVTYQKGVKVKGIYSRKNEAIPSTFEDALILENTEFFEKTIRKNGPTKKVKKAIDYSQGMKELNKKIYNIVADKSFPKAEFSLDILFTEEISKLKIPTYIDQGLDWLNGKLDEKNRSMSLAVECGDQSE